MATPSTSSSPVATGSGKSPATSATSNKSTNILNPQMQTTLSSKNTTFPLHQFAPVLQPPINHVIHNSTIQGKTPYVVSLSKFSSSLNPFPGKHQDFDRFHVTLTFCQIPFQFQMCFNPNNLLQFPDIIPIGYLSECIQKIGTQVFLKKLLEIPFQSGSVDFLTNIFTAIIEIVKSSFYKQISNHSFARLQFEMSTLPTDQVNIQYVLFTDKQSKQWARFSMPLGLDCTTPQNFVVYQKALLARQNTVVPVTSESSASSASSSQPPILKKITGGTLIIDYPCFNNPDGSFEPKSYIIFPKQIDWIREEEKVMPIWNSQTCIFEYFSAVVDIWSAKLNTKRSNQWQKFLFFGELISIFGNPMEVDTNSYNSITFSMDQGGFQFMVVVNITGGWPNSAPIIYMQGLGYYSRDGSAMSRMIKDYGWNPKETPTESANRVFAQLLNLSKTFQNICLQETKAYEDYLQRQASALVNRQQYPNGQWPMGGQHGGFPM